MAQPRIIVLRFPSLGVVRSEAHEHVASAVAYSSPWAINVRLQDSLTKRLRGGSFTGVAAGAKTDPVYRDRAITFSGAVITASRMGSHADTTFSSDVSDALRPVLWLLAEAGGTGGTVVAVVPHKDANMLCFTSGETWVLSGDPATGTLRNVSREVGIIASGAWCKNHDTVYFLSDRGLYSVGADGGGLKALSEEKLPQELIDVYDADCVLDYQHADRGVYIHLTESPSWFYDTARDQFWPFDLTTTESHVLLGPVRIGGPNQQGLLQTLHGIMATGSGTVVWRIVGATTAEAACANGKTAIAAALADSDIDPYIEASGAWDAGRSHTVYPRVRSPWIVLWLSSTATWAFESVVLEVVSPFGRIRQ